MVVQLIKWHALKKEIYSKKGKMYLDEKEFSFENRKWTKWAFDPKRAYFLENAYLRASNTWQKRKKYKA